MNCGNLDSLLQRLTKVSYFGLDFLNTFLTTFPIFTTAHVVLDFLIKVCVHFDVIKGPTDYNPLYRVIMNLLKSEERRPLVQSYQRIVLKKLEVREYKICFYFIIFY